jgi:hypothetical protein
MLHPEYQFFEYACHEGNYAMRQHPQRRARGGEGEGKARDNRRRVARRVSRDGHHSRAVCQGRPSGWRDRPAPPVIIRLVRYSCWMAT